MAKPKKSQEPEIVRRDGVLCAAFVNTASRRREPLESYADLLAWGEKCGVLSSTDVRRLERAAGERPAEEAAHAYVNGSLWWRRLLHVMSTSVQAMAVPETETNEIAGSRLAPEEEGSP